MQHCSHCFLRLPSSRRLHAKEESIQVVVCSEERKGSNVAERYLWQQGWQVKKSLATFTETFDKVALQVTPREHKLC